MAGNTPPSARQILGRLYVLVRPDLRDIWTIIVFSIVIGLLALGVPIAAQMLFNYVAFGALVQPLVVIAFMLLVVLSIGGTMRALVSFLVELLQRRIFTRVVGLLGERLPKVKSEVFDRSAGPDLVNRFFDVLTIQKVGATVLLDGIAAVLQTVIGLTIVAFYDPFLAMFSIVLFALVLFIVFVLGRRGVRTAVAESTAKYQTAAALESLVTEPRLFKQADGAGLANRLVSERIEGYLAARRKHFRVFFRQVVAAYAVQVLAATALLVIGGYLVIIERLSLGQLVAAELIVTIALNSLTKVAIKLDDIYDMFAGVYKVDGLLGLAREREGGDHRPSGQGPATLSIREVAFAYPDGPMVFEDLGLEVGANERVAMISEQADGKTTLADLLFGTRVPDAGRIEVDGIDVREMSLKAVRDRIAVAEYEEIIRGTVEENITLGRAEVTPTCCRDALERVGLLEELRALPEGLSTPLSPGGGILSRGQRARLAIARAIAGKPGLLVVDGLLDRLDAETRDRAVRGLTDPNWPCTVLFLGTNDFYSKAGAKVIPFSETNRRSRSRGTTEEGQG